MSLAGEVGADWLLLEDGATLDFCDWVSDAHPEGETRTRARARARARVFGRVAARTLQRIGRNSIPFLLEGTPLNLTSNP